MKRAFERRDTEGVLVIPIMLREVDLTGTPIKGLQLLPRSGKRIAGQDLAGRDEAWVEIVKEIRDACDKMQ